MTYDALIKPTDKSFAVLLQQRVDEMESNIGNKEEEWKVLLSDYEEDVIEQCDSRKNDEPREKRPHDADTELESETQGGNERTHLPSNDDLLSELCEVIIAPYPELNDVELQDDVFDDTDFETETHERFYLCNSIYVGLSMEFTFEPPVKATLEKSIETTPTEASCVKLPYNVRQKIIENTPVDV